MADTALISKMCQALANVFSQLLVYTYVVYIYIYTMAVKSLCSPSSPDHSQLRGANGPQPIDDGKQTKIANSDVTAEGTGVDSPDQLGHKTGGSNLGPILPAAPERSDNAARGSVVSKS